MFIRVLFNACSSGSSVHPVESASQLTPDGYVHAHVSVNTHAPCPITKGKNHSFLSLDLFSIHSIFHFNFFKSFFSFNFFDSFTFFKLTFSIQIFRFNQFFSIQFFQSIFSIHSFFQFNFFIQFFRFIAVLSFFELFHFLLPFGLNCNFTPHLNQPLIQKYGSRGR